MTETPESITVSRGWWQALVRPQNIIAVGIMVFGVGGVWKDYQFLKERVTRMEIRLDAFDLARGQASEDKAVMKEQLAAIQRELALLREEIHGVGREVKKIQ